MRKTQPQVSMYVLSVLSALGNTTNWDVISHQYNVKGWCVFNCNQFQSNSFITRKRKLKIFFSIISKNPVHKNSTIPLLLLLLLHYLHGMDSQINLSLNRHMHDKFILPSIKCVSFFVFARISTSATSRHILH